MPEMPDIEAYLEALRLRVLGQTLKAIRLGDHFLLRTASPLPDAFAGSRVAGLSRLGKRIVFEVTPAAAVSDGEEISWFMVLHLMITGRLHWKACGAPLPRVRGLAAFDFATGTLLLTEAGSKRRASLHLLADKDALSGLAPGGLEPLEADIKQFAAALQQRSHTVKRALTDPRIVAGVGNAYSDEILHRARISPLKLTRALNDAEVVRLHGAVVSVLGEWTERLRAEARERFPEKVTAFRPDMAVHGRFGEACSVCGAKIQRIVYKDNECDYCPGCQTEGRILADRSLSRLLRDDWPQRMEASGEER